MNIRITDKGGLKPTFTQWDVDRVLLISGCDSQPSLRFDNPELSRSIVVVAEADGADWKCNVPNFMLQFSGPMIVSVFIQPDEGKTVFTARYNVAWAKKPQDYTYEENIGYTNWVQKTEEAQELLDDIEDLRDEIQTAAETATSASEAAVAAAEDIDETVAAALQEAKDSGEFDGASVWWTNRVGYLTGSRGTTLVDQLYGRSGGTPAVGDLVVGPAPGLVGNVTAIYNITDISLLTAVMTKRGDLKGDTGATGATGAAGATGPQGPQGPQGLGFPAGGKALAVLRKKTDADHDTEWANPMDLMSDDVKQALLQLAQKVAYIDDQGSDYYQDLYDALYPPKELVSISAVFTQGQTVVYDTDSLDSLKPMLVVTGTYDDQSTETIPSTDYTLSGTLSAGTSTITVTCDGKTDTFTVTVTHQPGVYAVTNNLTGCVNSNSANSVTEGDSYSGTITASSGYTLTGSTVSITMGGVDITSTAYSNGTISIASVIGNLVITVTAVAVTLSSISAVYTQSGTVYTTDTLDSLKTDLVVTATYSDSSTETVAAADYTLSGTLTVGTSTITVSYSGKTDTFNVTVSSNTATLSAPFTTSKTIIDMATGNATSNSDWSATGYLELDSGYSKISFTNTYGGTITMRGAFYDSSKAFVTSSLTSLWQVGANKTGTINIPSGASYIRLSSNSSLFKGNTISFTLKN